MTPLFEVPFVATLPIVDNREAAILIWLSVLAIWAASRSEIRRNLVGVFSALTARPLAIVILTAAMYTTCLVLVGHQVGVWHGWMLKDTLIWSGAALILLFRHGAPPRQADGYFRGLLLDNFKVVLAIEFVVNFYVFPLPVELVFIPILVALVAIHALAGSDASMAAGRRFLDAVLAAIGIGLIVYALVQVVGGFGDFATLHTLEDFLLAPVLTLAFVPFVYLVALYGAYELVLIRADRGHDQELASFKRWSIIRECRLNLRRLAMFSRDYAPRLRQLGSPEEVGLLMREFHATVTSSE